MTKRLPVMAALAVSTVSGGIASMASAQQHTAGVPQLSSRPGAAYTIYLDPAGFNYDGEWLGNIPGNNLALNNRGPTETFNADDVSEIRAIWAAMANQFRCFDVNITTVDPAIAAGQDADDIQRRDYYDSQLGMMHTVIGPPGNDGWQGMADGLAGLTVIGSMQEVGSGLHTNWMFSQDVDRGSPIANGTYIGNISAHEGGHTFGLHHQGDWAGETLVNEYSFGDDNTEEGSYVPTMGNASGRQRVAWRVGSVNDGGTRIDQNDVAVILSNTGKSIVDSGIGHTLATATALPLAGSIVDVSNPQHAGWISPLDAINPAPMGVENYSTDILSFNADGVNEITLTLNCGNDLLSAGVADNAATFRGTLTILDSEGSVVGAGAEDSSTMFSTFTGVLPAGLYYAQINSFGGHAEAASGFNEAFYFDMGGYFLTGSGFGSGPAPCACDWNHDSTVTSQDFFDFITSFFSGDADINDDGMTTSQDFFDFLSCFFTGCP